MYLKEARKVIAVDLDGTLSNTLSSLVQWHNDIYNTNLKLKDFNTNEYWNIWGGTREESYLKIREFYDSSYFHQIQPIQDFALEALKMLKKRNFQLVIITSRQQFIAEKTKKFVDKHYPGIFESIYFCNLDLTDAEQLEYVSKPKSVICQEIGVDVLIDDCLEHAFDCASLGVEVLLYDFNGEYTWNHHKPATNTTKRTLTSTSKKLYQHDNHYNNIQRMFNWKDIIKQFPKPSSPLRYCYFPEEEEEEEEDTSIEDEDELFDNQSHHYKYETVEVEEMSDEDDCILWKDNRVWV